jgi:acyl carrier protein
MTGQKDTVGRITVLLRERMALEVGSAHSDLIDQGVLDSLALVTMLSHLEEEFGVRASGDDLELDNFRSIARIAAFVESRAAVKQTHDMRQPRGTNPTIS